MYAQRYSIRDKFTVNSSLFVTQCGYETCGPNHSFGPVARDHNLLHFVFSGKGTLEINHNIYRLEAGKGFFIPTGIQSIYTADKNDPWYYGWMGFDGENSNQVLSFRGISNNKIVFDFNNSEAVNKSISSLVSIYGQSGNSFMAISKMFEIFSYINPYYDEIISDSGIINDIITYIQKNYAGQITVQKISKIFNISRSQIFRIFKTNLDISPQQYIKYFRINHAADLLRRSPLNMQEIMIDSGFEDRCNFSRQFKSIYGRSPSEFRKYARSHTGFCDNGNST